MQTIRFGFVLLLLVGYASTIRYHDTNDFAPLPYQDRIEEVFHAFNKGDIDRMERNFKFLENIDPDKLHTLEHSNNTTEYSKERINYVVSHSIYDIIFSQ